MSRAFKAASFLLLAIVVGGGFWFVRFHSDRADVLTPVPGASSFEPRTWPSAPVLHNKTPGALTVDFGYDVGGVPYAYTLALTFPAGAAAGRAQVSVHHAGQTASTESDVTRRWDEPRKSYAVALTDTFTITPPVPALCIKAVIGPDLARTDLADGTICVARRDSGGECHPETLACGKLRD